MLVKTDGNSEVYGRAVIRELLLEVDGSAISLTLTRVETSSIEEVNEGIGSIRLTAVGRLREAGRAGRRHHGQHFILHRGRFVVQACGSPCLGRTERFSHLEDKIYRIVEAFKTIRTVMSGPTRSASRPAQDRCAVW